MWLWNDSGEISPQLCSRLPTQGGGQEEEEARRSGAGAQDGRIIAAHKARRPLTLSPSPAPQLMAANRSKHFKATMPHQVLAWSLWARHLATPSADTR